MQKVKLSSLKDGQKFIISKSSKVEYSVTQKVKGGVLVTAVISQRTYTYKAKKLVFINA